jgi:hypothetical protein
LEGNGVIAFYAHHPREGWVRFYVDEEGRLWATFGMDPNQSLADFMKELVSDGEPMNITGDPQFLYGYTIMYISV